MKAHLDCLPCLLRQALAAMRIHGVDEKTQRQVMLELGAKLPQLMATTNPPRLARYVYDVIYRHTGIKDPYQEIKKISNSAALKIYPRLCDRIRRATDPMLLALELAIAGNIIDYAANQNLELEREIELILADEIKADRPVFDYAKFKTELAKAQTILYLADNAGETVFDRLLIEQIKATYPEKEINYAVKAQPILNDALAEDAYQSGIDRTANIISSGSDVAGTLLTRCSADFLELFNQADMIISKGQGNYEALTPVTRPIFFLFRVKCSVVASVAGWQIGDIILAYMI